MRKILICVTFALILQNAAAMHFNPFGMPTLSPQESFLAKMQKLLKLVDQAQQGPQEELYHEADVVELIKIACSKNNKILCLDCVTAQILLDMIPRLIRNGVADGAQVFFVPMLINRTDDLLANDRVSLANHFVGIAIYTQSGRVTQIKYIDPQGKDMPVWLIEWLQAFFQKGGEPISITTVFNEQLHPQNYPDTVNCGPFLVQAFAELALDQAPTVTASGQELRSSHIQQLTAANKRLQPSNGADMPVSDISKLVDVSAYVGSTLNGLIAGQGSRRYPNGDVYTGGILNGDPNGYGTMKTAFGVHEGIWLNGVLTDSVGTIYLPSGSYYVGGVIDSKPNGLGVLHSSGGVKTHDGYWLNSMPIDKLKYNAGKAANVGIVDFDGNQYAGALLNGLSHGQGTMRYKNNNTYAGNWLNGERSGKGVYFQCGKNITYYGDWLNDRPNGQGIIEYQNGDVYNGAVDGKPNGKGIMKYKNGDVYEGVWLNSTDGEGTITFASGNTFNCKWKNSKPDGSGVMIYENGDTYEGALLDGVPHGYGAMEYVDGSKYDGEWLNGKPCDKK